MSDDHHEFVLGGWGFMAWRESRLEFNPATPVTYWVVRYWPFADGGSLGCMYEHVGRGRPADTALAEAARADFAERGGLAAG